MLHQARDREGELPLSLQGDTLGTRELAQSPAERAEIARQELPTQCQSVLACSPPRLDSNAWYVDQELRQLHLGILRGRQHVHRTHRLARHRRGGHTHLQPADEIVERVPSPRRLQAQGDVGGWTVVGQLAQIHVANDDRRPMGALGGQVEVPVHLCGRRGGLGFEAQRELITVPLGLRRKRRHRTERVARRERPSNLRRDQERLDPDIGAALVLHVPRGHELRRPELEREPRVLALTRARSDEAEVKGAFEGSSEVPGHVQPRSERIPHRLGGAMCHEVIEVDVARGARGALHDVDDAVGNLDVLEDEPHAALLARLLGLGRRVPLRDRALEVAPALVLFEVKFLPVQSDEHDIEALSYERREAKSDLERGDARDHLAVRVTELEAFEHQVPATQGELLNRDGSFDGGVRLLDDELAEPLSAGRRRDVRERPEDEDEHEPDERQRGDGEPSQPLVPLRAPAPATARLR